jgi:peroxiredoxin
VTSIDSVPPALPPDPPVARKPRKIFLLVGVLVAAALGVGLFTSLGTSATSGPPHEGGVVPSFSGPHLNGSGTVQFPAGGGGGGTPAVLLFFGNWCDICHAELPQLAAAVRHQYTTGGALAAVQVIGVDSEDTMSNGRAFVRNSGVTFPVAWDPNTTITNGAFYFTGDPYAVFVKANGRISAIVYGAISPAKFTAEEQKLIPSGS